MKSLSLASACKTEALMYIKAHIIDLETPSGILNLAKLSHSCHGNFGLAGGKVGLGMMDLTHWIT